MSSPTSSAAWRIWISWSTFTLLVVAVVAVPIVRHSTRPTVRNTPALAGRIRQAHPELRIVPSTLRGDISWGFYLCRPFRTDSPTSLHALVHRSDLIDDWCGVVLVKQEHRKDSPALDDCLEEHDIVLSPFTLFGDPELARLVAEQLRPARHSMW